MERHTVLLSGKEIVLTLKEYDLLHVFMRNQGIVLTRELLLQRVWGKDFIGETRTIDVHVGTLRSKLGTEGNQIKTIRGVGYRMGEEN